MNNVVLYPHQIDAIALMESVENNYGKGGILAHQMGLGKTITMSYFLIKKQTSLPDLIICPLAVISHWKSEILRLDPEQKVLVYHGPNRRDEIITDYNFIISTYHSLVTRELEKYQWSRVVLDEAHLIRNGIESKHREIPKKVIGAYALKKKSNFRWCITGTPFNNRLEDVLSQMNFLSYSPEFEAITDFVKNCVLQKDKEGIIEPYNINVVPVKEYEYEDLEIRNDIYYPYDMSYRKYIMFMRCYRKTANAIEASALYKKAMNQLTRTRIFCQLLVPSVKKHLPKENTKEDDDDESGEEEDTDEEDSDDEKEKEEIREYTNEEMYDFYTNSPKIKIICDKSLAMIHSVPHKRILIFSSFTTVLKVLEEILTRISPEIKILKYIGSMSKEKREVVVNDFSNSEILTPMILLASIGAGNCGINLVPCSTVFILDMPLNPFSVLQAINRVHRVTQKNKVNVYKFYMENLIEEEILKSHDKKIVMSKSIGLLNKESDPDPDPDIVPKK